MIRVCLVGLGKSGIEIARVLLKQEDIKLVAAVCSPGSEKAGKDLGDVIDSRTTGIVVEGADKLEKIIFRTKPDVVVDFSKPEATLTNAKVFSRMKINMVIATTGFSKIALKRLFILAEKNHSGIVIAPNITLGVNVLMLLSNIASNILSNYDFRIIEQHHNRKKDIPSGTALKIAGVIEKGLKTAGICECEDSVQINAVRAGGIVGRHEVLIVGDEDQLEITHQSFSRRAFAAGAIRAVKYIYKKSGFFEMSDVLDLGSVLDKCLGNQRSKESRRSYEHRKVGNYRYNDIAINPEEDDLEKQEEAVD
jgi:4-hydroxy-tetrahydrodipicolinate reductase